MPTQQTWSIMLTLSKRSRKPLVTCARRWLGCCGPSSSIMKCQVPSRIPRVFPLIWHGDDVRVIHVMPMVILALSLVDEDFGKQQLDLMLRTNYLHPNGQLPAYEWNFGDVNPPVHAWSTIFAYRLQRARRGKGDIEWLERSFQKLLLNFTWWVNRKDRSGRNAFEGGFLGLDNIGVFDRSAAL